MSFRYLNPSILYPHSFSNSGRCTHSRKSAGSNGPGRVFQDSGSDSSSPSEWHDSLQVAGRAGKFGAASPPECEDWWIPASVIMFPMTLSSGLEEKMIAACISEDNRTRTIVPDKDNCARPIVLPKSCKDNRVKWIEL